MRPALLRPRLIELLAGRWDHPVAVLRAGAGFGKTTALGQMVRANVMAPVGADRWLACRPADAEFSSLAAGLSSALDIEDLPPSDLGRQAELLAAGFALHSPGQVCLVIDDVHLVPAASAGAALLATLVSVLPTNGHVLFVGRTDPPVALARLDMQGRVLRVDEAELALTPDELSGFAELRGVPVGRVERWADWLALAELAASTGEPATVDRFLWEEVLGALDRPTLRTLAVVAELGSADEPLLRVATAALHDGDDLRLSLLADVPLVAAGDRQVRPHELWLTHVTEVLAGDERRAVQRAAADGLASAGQIDGAFHLFLAAGDPEAAADVLRVACDASHPPVPLDLLRSWMAELPLELHDRPQALLVQGVIAKAADHGPERALDLLERAVAEFVVVGDADGELAALVHLLHLGFWTGDTAAQLVTIGRIVELEQRGQPLAAPLAGLARGFLLTVAGDRPAALRELDRIPSGALNRSWSSMVDVVRAMVHVDDGSPAHALALIDAIGDDAGSEFASIVDHVRLRALWSAGRVEDFLMVAPDVLDRAERQGRQETIIHTVAGLAHAHAVLGDRPAAAMLVDRLDRSATSYNRMAGAVASARAALQLLDGDETAAAATLGADVAAFPLADRTNWYSRTDGLALIYVLVPDTRMIWDALPLPAPSAAIRDAARIVVAARDGEHDAVGRMRALPFSDGDAVLTLLPLPWAMELAVQSSAGARSDAHDPGRDWIERRRPPEPGSDVRIEVLGDLRLVVDGAVVTDPIWARSRVRQLLLYLLLHPVASRDGICDAMWPGLAPDAARNNLRVTLSYLNRLLEPGRPPGAAATVIHQDGPQLTLVIDRPRTTDVGEFAAALDAAQRAEDEGRLTLALAHQRRAVELYRGDLAPDVFDDWVSPDRARLRHQFTSAALRAGALALAEGRISETLGLADRVLASDPWSEAAHCIRAATHLAAGQRRAARQAIDGCLSMLAELGLDPAPATVALDRLIPG